MIIIHGKPIAGRMPPFRHELRQAIREGRKTQTRRIIKAEKLHEDYGKPIWDEAWVDGDDHHQYIHLPYDGNGDPGMKTSHRIYCPYGEIGDILAMTEPLTKDDRRDYLACYLDDKLPARSIINGWQFKWRWKVKTLSSLFMPTEAARTFVQIRSIRAERLQDIGKDGRKAADVLAEGITREAIQIQEKWLHPDDAPAMCFATLWEPINAKPGCRWTDNPWVWVIEWELLETAGK